MKMQVVVGLESAANTAPLRWAVEDLNFSDASFHIVHCVVGRIPTEMPYPFDDVVANAQRIIAEAISYAQARGVHADGAVEEGYAGELLVSLSKDANVLVIGSSRKRKWPRAYGTSVVKYCLDHSWCPVTVVSPIHVRQTDSAAH